jgi:hypothetical protein
MQRPPAQPAHGKATGALSCGDDRKHPDPPASEGAQPMHRFSRLNAASNVF